MKKLCSIAFIAIIGFTTPEAMAQGIPVYDASSFAQFVTQLDKMSQDYQKQLEQLDEAMKQTEAITGSRNAGDLVNGVLEQQLREYLPNTWQDTMNIINATGLPSGALGTQSIYNDLYTTYNPIPGAEFMESDPSGPVARSIDRRTGTTYAAMAASEQAYNNINDRIQIYEQLLTELNNSQDLKASVDLQARITAENGMILSELMRLNAIQMQQKASEDNEILTDYRRSSVANQYDATLARKAMELPQN
jgi:type IV secretion system protein VirB5